jgi:uncharacterized sulfatase
MTMEYTPPLPYLVRQSFKRYISLVVITIGLLILVRFYEILFVAGKTGYPSGSTLELILGIRFDLMLACRLSVLLVGPFLWIDHYNPRAANIFYASISSIVVLGNILLLSYFSTTRITLGSDILGYSLSEMRQIIGASGELSLKKLLPVILFAGIIYYVFRKWANKKQSSLVFKLVTTGMAISLLPIISYNPDPADYKSEFSMNITANKFNLFSERLLHYFFQKNESTRFDLNSSDRIQEENQQADNLTSRQPSQVKGTDGTLTNNNQISSPQKSPVAAANPFTYISQDYPFLHQETTPDLLAPFFKPGTDAPSIVFILVESLGRAYTGQGAYLGSFTPFLDSLMTRSLYWENCLSTSGRTFSVIPSMLASLPFGDKGFADLGDKMPDHLSLVSLLKNRAGYSSSFYYGGDPKFDNMEPFLKRQGTSKIVGIRDFGGDYKQLPSDKNGFSWGYGDREIFRKYLSDLKMNEKEKRVDLMLTLAMHNPFLIPEQDHYNALFEKRMADDRLTEDQKKYNRQYVPQFASMLYFDDALRYFFNEFSKLKSFEHTIFIITGDHRMPEIPISTQLDRFHVPLVVFSPMLKQGVKFSSIVTHYDVTPSLLTFLKNRMNISLPTVSAWIGHGLDTNTSFRNLNSYPLKRNTGELTDYISGDHFIAGATLYKVYPTLDIEPENNPTLNEQLQKQFANYKAKNNFATKGNQLIPDSLKKYLRP